MWVSDEDFNSHLKRMRSASVLFIDTEGSLSHPFSETWGLSYSSEGIGDYFPFNHHIGENLSRNHFSAVKEVVENHPCIAMHNAKHDLRALNNLGIDRRDTHFYDTMIMDHLVNENHFSYELEHVGRRHVGRGKAKSEQMDVITKNLGWEYVNSELMRDYATEDTILTEEVFDSIWPEFESHGFNDVYWSWMEDFIWLVADMESQGIHINEDFCRNKIAQGTEIMNDIKKYLGFNPGSSKQLGEWLLGEMNFPVVKRSKKTGAPSFDAKAMEKYDAMLAPMKDKRAQMVRTYKGWSKAVGSSFRPYLEKRSPEDGKFRAEYNLHSTVTGRMSCAYHHQIPRESTNEWNGDAKKSFVSMPGRTAWNIDYSQLEFRLGAWYGHMLPDSPGVGDLVEIFNDDNRDMFTETAHKLGFDERWGLKLGRQFTKTLAYTLQFTGGPDKVRETLGLDTYDEGKEIHTNWFRQYPGLKYASDTCDNLARRRGYIKNWMGRTRHFENPNNESYKAFSAAIQGGAFEIVKQGIVKAYRRGLIDDNCAMDLQVHDSGRFDIIKGREDEYLPEIIECFEDVDPRFRDVLHFKVECENWDTGEKYIPKRKTSTV